MGVLEIVGREARTKDPGSSPVPRAARTPTTTQSAGMRVCGRGSPTQGRGGGAGMTRQGTGPGARAKGEGGAGRDARSGGTAPGGTSTEEDHFHCFELQTSKS